MAPNEILVWAMFGTFIALLFTGFPIAWVLGGVGVFFAGIGYFADVYLEAGTGINYGALGMIANRLFKLMDNWIMVAIPMFMFMGLMLDESGIAERMMMSMQKLFGRVRGGLAITVVLIGTILAASTGIIGASVTLLGLLSIPAMLHQGYNKPLAAGVVAASGTLGILIPPSVMLVVLADQLSLSVGDLFMGAVLPGLLLSGLYITYILLLGVVRPDQLPLSADRPPMSWRMIWEVVVSTLPTVALIIAVLGSIFAGLATPTEASGIGALGAILLAWHNRRLSLGVVRKCAQGTMKMMGFVFGIFLGASLFALVLRLLGGDTVIGNAIQAIPLGPYGILGIAMGIIFILGFFLDWIEITLILLPILAPIVTGFKLPIEGYGVVERADLVWFCLLVAVCLQTSFLTPPVGFAIFFVQGIAPPEIKLSDIYKGVTAFVILQLVGLAAVLLWPKLVTWLPSLAYR